MRILCDGPAGRTLGFAARELERYLTRMGAAGSLGDLRLRVEGPAGEERFSLRLDTSGGEIVGSDPRSVLLGVYHCLRRLGCRFLGPGPECEVVPPFDPAALPLSCEVRPSFRHRGVCIEGADSLENILAFVDWLPKVGYNSFFLQFKNPYAFLKRWYHHERNPLLPPEPYTPADGERDMAVIEDAVKERGLLLHKAGHGWTGEVLGYEALSWDSDPQPLREDKRPLAAQVNGARGLWRGVPANTNLCFSHRDAVESFAGRVVKYAGEHPAVDYLHVWLADEYNNVCECPDCARTTLSDQYTALMNEIDRRLAAAGLSTRIVFLLYQELLWPPVRERLHNPDRFVMMFAPISRTFERSYQPDGENRPVPPYVRNRVVLPAGLGENLAFLRGWQRVFSGESFVYDYPLGRAHYGDFGYLKLSRVISGDIKQLHAMGLDGYLSCQELRAGCPNFLPNYVMGLTLLDEGADGEALMGEYLAAAYGEGAPGARVFLEELSRLGSPDYLNGIGPRQDPGMAARLGEAARLCERFTLPEGAQGPFWRVLGHHREYIRRLARAMEALAGGEPERAALWGELRSFLCSHETEFQPFLDVYRVLEVTSRYTGFQDGAT